MFCVEREMAVVTIYLLMPLNIASGRKRMDGDCFEPVLIVINKYCCSGIESYLFGTAFPFSDFGLFSKSQHNRELNTICSLQIIN